MEFLYTVVSVCGFVGFFLLSIRKEKEKEKKEDGKKEDDPKQNNMMKTIKELEVKSSMNAMDIQKLYLENCELRQKLDRIYANELNENISYYKNIVLMNEKIEYMQKCLLKRSYDGL
jgi:hypothetical protein